MCRWCWRNLLKSVEIIEEILSKIQVVKNWKRCFWSKINEKTLWRISKRAFFWKWFGLGRRRTVWSNDRRGLACFWQCVYYRGCSTHTFFKTNLFLCSRMVLQKIVMKNGEILSEMQVVWSYDRWFLTICILQMFFNPYVFQNKFVFVQQDGVGENSDENGEILSKNAGREELKTLFLKQDQWKNAVADFKKGLFLKTVWTWTTEDCLI